MRPPVRAILTGAGGADKKNRGASGTVGVPAVKERMDPMTLTRRRLLQASAAGAAAMTAGMTASFAPRPAAPGGHGTRVEDFLPTVTKLRDHVRTLARGWVDAGRLVRPDGFVYAVDVAQLMACFADAGDAEGYARLRDDALKHLVVDDRSDPYTRGFVLWRYNPGAAEAKRDASGTTEGLRTARALWLGARRFDRPADRGLARTILDGYSRHQGVEHGVWMIRNYFGFGTRSFATNSFLVDYDPDFVADVARETGEAELKALADKSYAAVRGALTPAGLLYDLIQPELKTMYPLLESVVTFSPNDVVQLSNATTVANTVAGGAPDVAGRVLKFATDRLGAGSLRTYHYGRTGEAVNDSAAGINEWSGLTRLAAALGDRAATAALLVPAVAAWDYYYYQLKPEAPDAYVASEALSAISAVLGM
jgi:hypothetical protein